MLQSGCCTTSQQIKPTSINYVMPRLRFACLDVFVDQLCVNQIGFVDGIRKKSQISLKVQFARLNFLKLNSCLIAIIKAALH
jgi:hypothetical protein